MTNADIGNATTFAIEGGTPATYEVVAEVISVTPPPLTRASVDATHLQSPDRYKEFIPGLFEQGECQLGLNYIPSAYALLAAEFEKVTNGNYRITFPEGSTFDFSGFFTGLTPPVTTPEGKMESGATIKPTGRGVFTDNSGV